MFLAYSVALRGSFVWWWQQQQRPRHRHRAHICCLLKQAVSACRMSLLVVTNANRVPLSQNVSHVPGLIQSWLARDPARHPHPHTLCVYACVLQYSFGFFGDRAEPSQPHAYSLCSCSDSHSDRPCSFCISCVWSILRFDFHSFPLPVGIMCCVVVVVVDCAMRPFACAFAFIVFSLFIVHMYTCIFVCI